MRTYRAEMLRALSRGSLAFVLLCTALMLFAMANAGPQHQPPLWGFRNAAIFTATLVMGRAAVVAATDYSTTTIKTWLICVRAKPPLFAGKLAAAASAGALTALIAGLACYAASGLFGRVPSPGAMAAADGRLALACVVMSIFGHAVGVLTKNVPAALTVTIGWILPAESLLQGTSKTLDHWLPGRILQSVTLAETGSGAALRAAVPFIALDLLALAVFLRRDIND